MLGAIIPKSWALYGALIAVVVLALLGIRWEAGHAAVAKMEAKQDRDNLEALIEKRKVAEDVKGLSDDDLVARITKRLF